MSDFHTNNAEKLGFAAFSKEYAAELDSKDELASFRNEFIFPLPPEGSSRDQVIYFVGNSLGLQPKKLAAAIQGQLTKWGEQAVEGHFEQPTPWLTIDDIVVDSCATLVGGKASEVVVMNTLTANLHFMMASFYTPTKDKFKIITEKKAFPSDTYAVQSQILHHGYDPTTALVEIGPREGEHLIRTEDLIEYYTGQLFDMELITKVGHEYNCIVGFDLAHAMGNVPMHLHDWDVDFACWCSYKYLNCGPGSIAGAFVHDKFGTVGTNADGTLKFRNRLSGWWGHRLEDRFVMGPDFVPCPGAYGFRLSNPSVLLVTCLRTSLDLYDAAGIERLRAKSLLLTGYLELLLKQELSDHITILTPSAPSERGCQLSISFNIDLDEAAKKVAAAGIMCDIRRPNVMRVAPVPLYNSFSDVFEFVSTLKSVL